MKGMLYPLLKHKWWVLAAAFTCTLLVLGPTAYANLSTRSLRYSTNNVPAHKIALVFGAGVLPDGTPTPYLQLRIQAAAKLYKAHRVQIVLMSGDNSTSHHNEPVAMGKYAQKLGVPAKSIVLDYAGFNTYDSCYRAKAIFGVRSAIVVSHGYHLPRAISVCRGLGVQAIGVAADEKLPRQYSMNYLAREVVSTDKAALQNLFKPHPTVLGKPEPIK